MGQEKLTLISANEAADVLDRPPHAVYRMVREEILPPGVVVRFGRTVRFNRVALINFVERGGTAANER